MSSTRKRGVAVRACSKRAAALFCALAFSLAAAGCHRNNLSSGYGIGWFTLTSEPSNFASYKVIIDSVVLVGKVNGGVTVVATPELVDFTKLKDVSELWSSASVPTDTYTQAIITLDYTSANISVLVNGAPQQATVLDSTGAVPTTLAVTVNLDPTNLAYIIPTYATTSGIRLALDFDLSASNVVDFTTSPATVTVKPYFTIATSAADNRLLKIRGPLVNTSLTEQTYSVYVRPFYDEFNTLGTLTLFDNASSFTGSATASTSPTCPATVPLFTVDGTSYTGQAGINVLSQTSAGSTMTQSYATYVPTTTPIATAAIFCTVYMIGGSTLEDFYTEGLEGDVIARNGNTLTVRGATVAYTDDSASTGSDQVYFYIPDATVTVGSATQVTQDGTAANGSLNYNSISVGDHIIARGITDGYFNTSTSTVSLDATGSSTNTGSVRLRATEVFGSLVSSTAGSLELNLADIGIYPASAFNFAGTGTSAATDAVAASYLVNTGALTLPADLTVGGPVFADGIVAPFGAAPPDFNALAIPDETAVPATIVAAYVSSTLNNAGTFASLTGSSLTLNLGDNLLISAQIHIGAEVIDATTLAASPTIIPVTVPTPPLPNTVATSTPTLPPVFLPLFSFGGDAVNISCFNTFATFVTSLNTAFAASPAASVAAFTARGTYNRATNQFTADVINVVLD